MDRRTFLRTGIGGVGALFVASCTKDNKQKALTPGETTVGGTLAPAPRPVVRQGNTGGDVGLPNPFTALSGPGSGIVDPIYDTLLQGPFQFGAPLIPWLASRFDTSADGLTYTFDLRDNVRWHDGQPFGPDDVVFTFEYFAAQRSKLPPNLIGSPSGVAQVRATGGRTVEIRLQQADVAFAKNSLTLFHMVPKHVWSSIDDPTTVQDQNLLIGTGPYRLDTYTKGEGAYAYNANEDFFLGKPFVRRIEYRPVGDEVTALQAGDIDVAQPGGPGGARPEVLAPFRNDPAFEVSELTTGGFNAGLHWNLTRGGALADVRFRQACAKAINRNDLVQRLLGGNGQPGNPGFLPPSHPYYAPVEQYAFDPAAANRMLDDAGYARTDPNGVRNDPNGRPLRFGLLTVNPPLGEVLVGALRAIGVEATVQPAGQLPQAIQAVTQGNFDIAVIIYGGALGDPDYVRGVFSSKLAPNQRQFFSARGYADPELDDLLDKQRTIFNDADRKRQFVRIQEIVARDIPLMHLYYPTQYRVSRKTVFDQWPGKADPVTDKQALVTGQKTQELKIRPTK